MYTWAPDVPWYRLLQLALEWMANTTLVYLAQTEDEDLQRRAEAAAGKLGLAYRYRFTGYGELGGFLQAAG